MALFSSDARSHSPYRYSSGSWGYVPSVSMVFFFFFQAEDGIRDSSVTGVQTCALPISERGATATATAPDRRPAYATLPLRFFLGVTFLYAGLQKIADPGFLRPGASTYIGTQLQAFAAHSPIGFLVESLALPAPQLAGIGVIAAELVIGMAVLFGVATRWAAA